jgi:glutamyl-tRNA synthetase
MKVRVRYAPSPTGLQHIGGIRTALFNYFFARANKGKFILRIEDTDQSRYDEKAVEDLYATLKWLGIDWDEGPVVGGPYAPYQQSERFELYKEYAEKLIDDGKAYRCYCTSERLEKVRQEQTESKSKVVGYDRHCRNLSKEEIASLEKEGKSSVVRFKIPLEGKTVVEDLLMGSISRRNSDISPDPVLLKSDGFPTYHLANVIDDHFMEISHIMRAQEWIPSGPLHVLLYEAFGWETPKFCHLPMVMGKDGQKLSKRHGSTAVKEFIEQGYLSEALINYVSMVGWSYDDKREFFTKEQLSELFSLDKISKSPGVFDYKKLLWYNGHYIREKGDNELLQLLKPFMAKEFDLTNIKESQLLKLMPIVKERLKTLSDIGPMVKFLFVDIGDVDAEALLPKNVDKKTTLEILQKGSLVIERLDELTNDEVESELMELANSLEQKVNAIFMPLRVAVTGSLVSPPLFDSMRLLGLEKTMARIKRAIEILQDEVENG